MSNAKKQNEMKKFKKQKDYDTCYGYITSYVFENWIISKNENSSWFVIKDGCFIQETKTLKVAKDYVLGSIKINNNK